MQRLTRAALVLLAMGSPGCITAMAAVAGADSSTVSQIATEEVKFWADVGGEVIESAMETSRAHAVAPEEEASGLATWTCELANGETQPVRAETADGARRICGMSNEAEAARGHCRCSFADREATQARAEAAPRISWDAELRRGDPGSR